MRNIRLYLLVVFASFLCSCQTLNIAGITFSNVIHTKLDLSYDIFGSLMEFGFYEYDVAKNVGIVRIKADVGAFGTIPNQVPTLLIITYNSRVADIKIC